MSSTGTNPYMITARERIAADVNIPTATDEGYISNLTLTKGEDYELIDHESQGSSQCSGTDISSIDTDIEGERQAYSLPVNLLIHEGLHRQQPVFTLRLLQKIAEARNTAVQTLNLPLLTQVSMQIDSDTPDQSPLTIFDFMPSHSTDSLEIMIEYMTSVEAHPDFQRK